MPARRGPGASRARLDQIAIFFAAPRAAGRAGHGTADQAGSQDGELLKHCIGK